MSVAPTQGKARPPRVKLNMANRMVALALALIWIIAGLAVVALGLSKGRWLLLPIGTVAVWYGLMWIRVVREGRRLQRSEALRPWRRS